MIVKSEAVVLRTRKYGDTSTIATLYTDGFGKVSALAKGDRERGAKGGGALDVLSIVSVVFYKKEHRELQLLSRVEHRRSLKRVEERLEHMAAGMVMLELADVVTPAEERNPALYRLLVDSLTALDTAERNTSSLVFFFETHLLDILGFRPSWDACVRCGSAIDPGDAATPMAVDPVAGGTVCRQCADAGPMATRIQSGTYKFLSHMLSRQRPEEALTVSMSASVRQEAGSMLMALLAHHVSWFKPLKSQAVFEAITQTANVPAA